MAEHQWHHVSEEHAAAVGRVFRYIGFEGAEATLNKRKLRFASPASFNDPFDCTWDALWQGRDLTLNPECSQLVVDMILGAKAIDESRFVTPRDRDNFYSLREEASRQSMPPHKLIELLRPSRQDILNRTSKSLTVLQNASLGLRLLCLSTDASALPIWSHYADKHRGCIIELDVSKIACPSPIRFGLVKYESRFPSVFSAVELAESFIYGLERNLDRAISSWLFTKSKDWEYERECRIVTAVPQERPVHHFADLPASAVRRVSMGCMATPESVSAMIELCNAWAAPLPLFQSKLIATEFAVEPFSEPLNEAAKNDPVNAGSKRRYVPLRVNYVRPSQ